MVGYHSDLNYVNFGPNTYPRLLLQKGIAIEPNRQVGV